MRKIYIAILLIFGLGQTVQAQGKGKVEFGLNLGYNFSSVADSETSSDSGAGMNVGASMDYYFSKTWSIKAKLIYDQKGWNNAFITNEFGNDVNTNINLNYITIPVMANWHFASEKNWYLHFGPYIGFLVDAKETRYDTDLTEGFNKNDFGFAYGIGVKIPVSTKLKVFIEFDGQSGFSDIFEYNQYESVSNSRGSLNVGLNFLMN